MAMLARAIAYAALAGACLATGITLDRVHQAMKDARLADTRDVERHSTAIDLQATGDADSTPSSTDNHNRLRQSDKSGLDRQIHSAGATAGKDGSATDGPKRARSGTAIPQITWVRSVDVAGLHP